MATSILKYCKPVRYSCLSSSSSLPKPNGVTCLLSAYQFTANSQGNSKFTEFVHLYGANYLVEIANVLPTNTLHTYFTYSPKLFCQFVVLPIC